MAADVEFEELPHGRVVYNAKTSRFTMLCDLCIPKNRKLVQKMKFASSSWGCRRIRSLAQTAIIVASTVRRSDTE